MPCPNARLAVPTLHSEFSARLDLWVALQGGPDSPRRVAPTALRTQPIWFPGLTPWANLCRAYGAGSEGLVGCAEIATEFSALRELQGLKPDVVPVLCRP